MLDISIIVACFLITLFIGLLSSKRTTSMRDFAVADKRYTTPILVATISATWIGGGDLLHVSENIKSIGIIFASFIFADCISKLIIAKWIAPRMGQYSNMLSIGDVIAHHYGRSGRVITGIAGTFMEMYFVGAQVVALGYLCHLFLGITYPMGIMASFGLVVLYAAFGGVRAVTHTDVFQLCLLVVSFSMVCSIGLNEVGGHQELFASLPESHRQFFPAGENPWKYVGLIVLFCLPKLTPSMMQRLLMARDATQIRKSLIFSALAELPLGISFATLSIIALVLTPSLSSDVSAIPALLDTILPVGVKGLAVAGLFAAIMSSADSSLNAASITLTHDVIKPLTRDVMSDPEELRLARLITIALGCLVMVGAISFTGLAHFIPIALFSWLPLTLVPLVACLLGVKAQERTFLASAIGGVAGVLLWCVLAQNALSFLALLPGVLGSAFTFTLSHWFSPKEKYNKRIASGRTVRFEKPVSKQFKIPGLNTLAAISAKRVEEHGAQYMIFAVFAVFNYIVPYFMWTPCDCAHPTIMLTLRGIAGVLCVVLILRDFWPGKFQKYLPLYWHFTLFYCLPFLTTYMLIDNRASMLWLLNMSLMLLLMVILVDWQVFIVLLGTGVAAGSAVFRSTHDFWPVDIDSETLFIATYMCFFAVLIGATFSRNREINEKQRLQSLQAMAGVVAHEMRTPLTAMRGFSRGLERYLPTLIQGYESAKIAGLTVGRIDPMAFQSLKSIPEAQDRISRKALTTIDMLLLGLKDHRKTESIQTCSMAVCIREALAEYPFSGDQERTSVVWDDSFDFKFKGNADLMVHVYYNLLRNALYSIKAANKGGISITLERTRHDHCVRFRDTGTGIHANQLTNIFKRFQTNKRQGSGLGLSFCKNVIESFGGHITCHSILGEYTEFVMRFSLIGSDRLMQDPKAASTEKVIK